MTKETTAQHCVQCGNEMVYGVDMCALTPMWINNCTAGDTRIFHIKCCHNPKCPNFSLLTVGVEGMASIPNQLDND